MASRILRMQRVEIFAPRAEKDIHRGGTSMYDVFISYSSEDSPWAKTDYDNLLAQYDATPWDWRPFSSTEGPSSSPCRRSASLPGCCACAVVPPRRKLAAQCCWNVNDASDIQRYILAAAGHIGQERRQAARSAENPTMMLQRASVALNRFDPGHTVVGG